MCAVRHIWYDTFVIQFWSIMSARGPCGCPAIFEFWKGDGMSTESLFERWRQCATEDADVAGELAALARGEGADSLEDRFYRDLEFGTGGLRGLLGAGTNRMNIYMVRKATQGLAQYLLACGGARSVAIGYDSRLKSDLFAREAAQVCAANGLVAHLYPRLEPTPALSFAVRRLGCGAGVCITASHNPAQYNGYKVYGPDGGQITTEAAAAVQAEIEKVDPFEGVRTMGYDEAVDAGRLCTIGEEVLDAFVQAVLALRVDACPAEGLRVAYTPLNGAGLECVTRALSAMGMAVDVVPDQEQPDGHFPTCPYPNPEKPEAMRLVVELAQNTGADIALATDPDCDRLGVAVRVEDGYKLLTGNEVGVLLLDHICRTRVANGSMPKAPVAVKTVVTTDMALAVAGHYGVELREVLTGFKFIGEQIGLLEAQGRVGDYLFGFEESYGYLSGSHVRDKDAVNAAMLVCELAAACKRDGQTLLDRMQELYARYGYYLADLADGAFEGPNGMREMQEKMDAWRRDGLPGVSCVGWYDYLEKTGDGALPEGVQALPAANVLSFSFSDLSKLVIRPSGTEPKMKVYVSAVGASRAGAEARLDELRALAARLLGKKGAD